MEKILEILKQRRVWAGICALIAFVLPLFGVTATIDVNGAVDAIMKVIEGLSSILAIGLPLWSYFKPKA